jgi:hypothetical protein
MAEIGFASPPFEALNDHKEHEEKYIGRLVHLNLIGSAQVVCIAPSCRRN